MTTLREAAQQALEAMQSFESGTGGIYAGEFAKEIADLREALAEPESAAICCNCLGTKRQPATDQQLLDAVHDLLNEIDGSDYVDMVGSEARLHRVKHLSGWSPYQTPALIASGSMTLATRCPQQPTSSRPCASAPSSVAWTWIRLP